MTSIVYVGMDVHTTNFTLCCYSITDDHFFAEIEIAPKVEYVLKYLNKVRKEQKNDTRFQLGYEAGCLGYSLYHQLAAAGEDCIILAPSTMPAVSGKRVKTDRRDARNIAKCLAYHTYSAVHIPTEEDNAVKEYIRMRDDAKDDLKRAKQQLIAFCTRLGYHYDGNYWTKSHTDWLDKLNLQNNLLNEVKTEYLARYYRASEQVDLYDYRIEQIASSERYCEDVGKLGCLTGIAVYTALAIRVEVGDFKRFPTASHFAAFLGLVPGEHSSGDKQCHTGVTKTGNCHLRMLLTEAAHAYGRGPIGKKSKRLIARQKNMNPEIIAYADKANDRLKRKYYRLSRIKNNNIVKTAIARELACFIWGIMTENTKIAT